ncbi:hypothetical protein D9T17_22435 [Lysobacter enzymogenes]|uniref:Uncharacterized protein n=1 Tax=Lysobacter enzymogenes TaxID=69 RepID=A0A3N2RBS6_LYSEN|nr:hypothetical protein D9T17_22435 [Lysobacter enzymogenes]
MRLVSRSLWAGSISKRIAPPSARPRKFAPEYCAPAFDDPRDPAIVLFVGGESHAARQEQMP